MLFGFFALFREENDLKKNIDYTDTHKVICVTTLYREC